MLFMKKNNARSILLLAGCIIMPLVIGFVGALFTTPNIPIWYAFLNKPWFNPPNWLFAPVWTILYILMGISLWLVIKDGFSKPGVFKATYLFVAQLLVNLLWSVVFFGMHSLSGGFVIILLLIILIFETILLFRKISPYAAYLLVPYICWTIFAWVLNANVLLLN
jgi:translocator protein